MKHKYAEMIKAKADKSELILLVFSDSEWIKSTWDFPQDKNGIYFMCHPKHVTEVLHVLNGGSVELVGMTVEREVEHIDHAKWSRDLWYMGDNFEAHIKPKKETRWIFVDTQFGFESSWCSNAYPSRELAMKRMEDWKERGADVNRMQIIEIEIEVE